MPHVSLERVLFATQWLTEFPSIHEILWEFFKLAKARSAFLKSPTEVAKLAGRLRGRNFSGANPTWFKIFGSCLCGSIREEARCGGGSNGEYRHVRKFHFVDDCASAQGRF